MLTERKKAREREQKSTGRVERTTESAREATEKRRKEKRTSCCNKDRRGEERRGGRVKDRGSGSVSQAFHPFLAPFSRRLL